MRRAAAIIAALIVSGCCSTQVPVKCPPLKAYSTLEQSVLAGELAADGPETQTQIEDYFALRAACRAAGGEK